MVTRIERDSIFSKKKEKEYVSCLVERNDPVSCLQALLEKSQVCL